MTKYSRNVSHVNSQNIAMAPRRMTKTLRRAEAILWLGAIFLGNVLSQGQSASPQGSFLEVDGTRLYYEECGSAPQAVVLVHDGVLDSSAWDDVWPEFCKHFHAIRYDRRGYGRSPVATAGYYATDDLAAILHHLQLKRVAIVGSSHGGEISINFTLDHPEMVERLALERSPTMPLLTKCLPQCIASLSLSVTPRSILLDAPRQ